MTILDPSISLNSEQNALVLLGADLVGSCEYVLPSVKSFGILEKFRPHLQGSDRRG